jgi:dihydroxyacetone kinase DhaKLM complex PTS-EIIA-like component DhaM
MKHTAVLCAVCICLAVVGCGTTIESVKADIPSDTKINNVYAVLDMGSGAPTFNELVKDHFERKFQEASINGVVRLVTGFGAGPRRVRKRSNGESVRIPLGRADG